MSSRVSDKFILMQKKKGLGEKERKMTFQGGEMGRGGWCGKGQWVSGADELRCGVVLEEEKDSEKG